MTNNIVHIPDEIRSEFRIDADGKAFVSIRGAARIVGINDKTLSDSFKTAAGISAVENTETLTNKGVALAGINPSKLAQMLLDSGFAPSDFAETGIPDVALVIVLKYYAFKAKRTTEQAERFYDAMSAIGVRTWIQQQLNWNPVLNKAPFWYQRLVLFLAQNKVPVGYFSIFEETIKLVGDLETVGYVIPDNAIPDISIGKCWATHLRSEDIEPNEVAVAYSHQYPDKRNRVNANAYPEEMLPKFRKWFRETYKPVKLPAYPGSKDKTSLPALSKMLDIPITLLK
jgi:hypothetical protein